ncbi:hypothetical protein FH039_08200 [Thermococcus indicus]|uniref:Uncharacterized protein n=1 Tax=Thermococcus indicus TaxID=2586643 RepID=A0A4Y5SML0_9EURY|nr:hypothetical protein [Thermococcus indicus]QDA31584.1 hypothetical protein FH039_08200 [Thermococcus indicus]
MKLFTRKYLAVLVIVGVTLLAVVQWWSYRQVGEVLEDCPATSVVARYRANVSPLLPSMYVRSIRDSIVGYSYEPSDGTYVLLVRGRAGKPDEYYRLELQSLETSYLDYLNLTAEYIELWSETGNESVLIQAASLLRRTLGVRAELENFKRGENVTAVLMEPPYPYRLFYRGNPLPGEIVLSLLLIAGTILLLSRLDVLIEVLSDSRNLALILAVIVGVSLVSYGLLQEHDPLLGVRSKWVDRLNFCGERDYYVRRNAAVDSILLDAIGSTEYVRVERWNGRVLSITLALLLERAEGLLDNLSEETTVLYVYSLPSWPERLEIDDALVSLVREDLLGAGELDEGAVDAVMSASLEGLERSWKEFRFCENITIMTFEFGRGGW